MTTKSFITNGNGHGREQRTCHHDLCSQTKLIYNFCSLLLRSDGIHTCTHISLIINIFFLAAAAASTKVWLNSKRGHYSATVADNKEVCRCVHVLKVRNELLLTLSMATTFSHVLLLPFLWPSAQNTLCIPTDFSLNKREIKKKSFFLQILTIFLNLKIQNLKNRYEISHVGKIQLYL